MASLLSFLVLLFLGSEVFSISINDILGFGYRRLVESPESPRVVEVIRWRQSVCLTGAPGVLPCFIGLQSPDNSGDINPGVGKTLVDNPKSISPSEIGESSLNGSPDLLAKRKTRQTSVPPRLYSPKVVERLSLEKMGSSSFDNPVQGSPREARYLRVGAQTRGQTIYKVKVIDSPVVAKLVAETCLPDIGIPSCDEERDAVNPSYRKPPKVDKPLKPISKPSISVPVVSAGGGIELWQQNQGTITNGQNPQGVLDFLNRPSVIQMDKEPNVDQVLVVQPTSSPSIFSGINGLLPVNPLPQLPFQGFFQIPGIPSLQQILYRPENEISENQGILGVLTGGQSSQNPPGTGPPTERPGIFGGLFSSPSRPVDFDAQATNTPAGLPSIFNGFGNVFNPANRPLLIERPNKKPILVEKPVYVIERPAAFGLFDILQNPLAQSGSSATEQPDVLKDPVYVLQKPAANAPLFGTGLLPNWNLFNIAGVGTTTTTEEPEIDPEGIFAPAYPSNAPLIDPRLPEAPEIPEKPIIKPLADNTDATIFSAAGVAEKDEQGSSSSFSVSLLNAEGSKKDLKESEGGVKNSVKKTDEQKIIGGDQTAEIDENLSNLEFGKKKIGSEIAEDKPVENEA